MKPMSNLDVLRTMAVSMVVLQHILLTMRIYRVGILDIGWLGYFGVFLFFIHTSLVLMWSLERNSDPLNFYVRRVFRIYPLAILAVLMTVTFHLPAIRNGNGDAFYWAPGVKNVISNLLLTQNLFWGPNILGVMWSLPLEIDMYIMLPFLFWLTAGKSAIWRLLSLWAAIAALDFSLLPVDTAIFPMFIPHFLAGAIAYIGFSKFRPRLPSFMLPAAIVASLLVFLSIPSMRRAWLFTLILGLALPFFRPNRAKWVVAASHHIAKYSYGIYLVHPFCVVIGLKLLHQYSLPIRLAGIFLPLATIVIPAYHFIEKPMIDLGWRLGQKVNPVNIKSHDEQAEVAL
jgi:peptidoglycan/LPS O-acetylase OafA/YrhL